jgi:hypothetical protein
MEWVAVTTFVDEYRGMFYEEGGIYDHKPRCKFTAGRRLLDPNESTAVCPRCGQRFAVTEESSAETNRDLHFDGDEDIPSICRHLPARRAGLMSVVSGA